MTACEQCSKPSWRASLQRVYSPLMQREVVLCRACRECSQRKAVKRLQAGYTPSFAWGEESA